MHLSQPAVTGGIINTRVARSSHVAVHRASRAANQQLRSGATAAAVRTEIAEPPTKDVTAGIMRAVMTMSLKSRLKQYQSVDADVVCDALGLLEGRFDALSIEGRHWVTPLNMTAHKLEVDIGTMQVDYGVLVWQQKVAMKNVPTGRVQIHLSAKDMGNFVSHPLFKQAAATAIHGQPFHFDKDSVQIKHSITGGEVQFTGTLAANGERYRVLMLPGKTGPGGGRGRLQVGAQHMCSTSSSSSSSVGDPLQAGNAGQPATDLQGAQAVASGMANFFSNLSLDLQGIEIRHPLLTLHPGDTSDSAEGDLLEIDMSLRLRAFPPLDMQF